MALFGVLLSIGVAASEPPTSVSPSADDMKIICEMELVTGSQIRERICRTKAQWKKIEEDAEKERENSTSMPALSCNPDYQFGTCFGKH
ncbi:MAG: hypothetical protein ACTHKE_10730 [Sphingomicrobium sp.]